MIFDKLRPYAGRWVALVQGRVAGVGLTAEAAQIAAQLSRPKEKPQVLFVPDRPELEFPSIVHDVRRALPAEAQVWLVGGAVRDALLNRHIHDLDFAVDGDALAAARAVTRALHAAFYPMDSDRDVGRVIVAQDAKRFTLDFARLRGPDLTADLTGRDFTLNALAVPLDDLQNLIDPLHGEDDLRAKLIRMCSPQAIANDPIRGIRAVRLAAQLDFKIEKGTREAVRAQAGALSRTSVERRRDELIRCLGSRPSAAVRALDLLGFMPNLLPELSALKGVTQSAPHVLDVWEHSLAVVTHLDEVLAVLRPIHDVDAASDLTLGLISIQLGRHREVLSNHLSKLLSGDRPARWLLMLATLLHDVGKPQTRTVEPSGRIRFLTHEQVGSEIAERRLARLHFSSDEVKRAKTIIANHMRPRQLSSSAYPPSRRAIYRFFRTTGEAGVDIVLLSLADFLGKYGGRPPPQEEWAKHVGVCAELLKAYFERAEEFISPPTLITGHDLMSEFGLEAGPQLGNLLESVREAQAAGEIADRAGALKYVRERLNHQ